MADLKFGALRLRRSPAFSAITVLLLGTSIVFVTVVAALFRSVVLEPLAYHEPARWYRILALDVRQGQRDWLAPVQVERIRRARGLESLGVSTTFPARWGRGVETRRIQRAFVSDDSFATLGATPALGRLLGRTDGDPESVVLSHRFWRREWQADPDVLGASLEIDGREQTVVGVASASTHTHGYSTPPADVWILFPPETDGRTPTSAS